MENLLLNVEVLSKYNTSECGSFAHPIFCSPSYYAIFILPYFEKVHKIDAFDDADQFQTNNQNYQNDRAKWEERPG